MKKYVVVSEGKCTQQVVQHIFLCFSEQINLARRFVSEFCMQTDATFNINQLHLSLSIIVDIINISKTFLLAFCFITSELTETFKFINTQLKKLMFYDCSSLTVIVRDFSKDLGVVMKGVKVIREADEDMGAFRKADRGVEAFKKDSGGVGGMGAFRKADEGVEGCILQLCEWHAVETIKKQLVIAEQYIKKRWKELINFI